MQVSACQYKYHYVDKNHEPQETIYHKDLNLALILSGAGSKGIAHAGVIAAFEAHDIPIDLIVGTSVGSIVGVIYADNKDIKKTTQILMNADRQNFMKREPVVYFMRATVFNDPADFRLFTKFLQENVKATKFEQLQIPVVAVTTDATHNKAVAFNSGPIAPAVLASCAIPGLYRPVHMKESLFIDGGIASQVPVQQAMTFKPKITVAVNIFSSPPNDDIKNNVAMLYRTSWIAHYQFAKLQSQMADFIINVDATGYDWLNDPTIIDKTNLFQLGFKAAEDVIKANKQLLRLSKKAAPHEKSSSSPL